VLLHHNKVLGALLQLNKEAGEPLHHNKALGEPLLLNKEAGEVHLVLLVKILILKCEWVKLQQEEEAAIKRRSWLVSIIWLIKRVGFEDVSMTCTI